MILLALVISSMLNNKKLKFKGFFRTAIFLPCVTSLVAYSIVFKSLFATDGFVNAMLVKLNIIAEPISWITDPVWAKVLIIVAITWRWTGYNMVFYLSGLQGIDDSIYEAAEIDGANAVQSFFKITVPLISPTMFFVVVTRVIASLQVFDSIFMMIDRSSPALTKTQSLVYLFYRYAFIENNKGYGSAIVVLLLCVIMVITVFQMYAQKKWVHYD